MVNPIQRGASLESRHVVAANLAQFAIGGDDGSFAPAGDEAFLRHCWNALLSANNSHLSASIIGLRSNGKCAERLCAKRPGSDAAVGVSPRPAHSDLDRPDQTADLI
jgi:hypothetical protein